MSTIWAADLLDVWEQGQWRLLSGRARALLAMLGLSDEAIDRLSVGQRDALLIDLRGRIFGSDVASVADCPACAEHLELTFDLRDVCAAPPGDPTAPFELTYDGYTLLARPPCVADLATLDPYPTVADRRAVLLRCCVLEASHDEQTVTADELPAPIVAQLGARLAEADPQSDVQLALDCPACGHTWRAAFDIVSFFWHELDTWAHRLLRDVHTLASAYGWREADILALSPERRSFYLELVRG